MRFREWLGVGEQRWERAPNEEVRPAKTLWDWLQLLIVPAILVAVTFAWGAVQTRNDNRREDRRSQDATLQAYLNEMSGLMLDKKLLASEYGDPVRAVARSVTLTVLRRLDGERKGQVVRFLYEAQLLNPEELELDPDEALDDPNVTSKVSLEDADLRGANLMGANLTNANFNRANLAGAKLKGTILGGRGSATLVEANLTGADLRGVYATDADLSFANLTNANLEDAFFRGAIFRSANLN